MAKQIVREQTLQKVDFSTGELLEETTVSVSVRRENSPFTMLMDDGWTAVTTLSDTSSKLLRGLMTLMNKHTNLVVFSSVIRRIITAEIGVSPRMMDKAIRDLKDRQILIPYLDRTKMIIAPGHYYVSPFFVTRCNTRIMGKLRKQLASDIDYMVKNGLWTFGKYKNKEKDIEVPTLEDIGLKEAE